MREAGIPYGELLERRTAQLRACEERLRTMIEENLDGIVILDGEGQIRYANPAAQHLFGCGDSELRAGNLGLPMVTGESCEIQIRRRREAFASLKCASSRLIGITSPPTWPTCAMSRTEKDWRTSCARPRSWKRLGRLPPALPQSSDRDHRLRADDPR
jgi:PAS domain-containing protein